MAFWKQKYNRTEGFSLVEVVVAITILGFIAVPMLSGLLFSYRLNRHSDDKMQAQLAVSSAVETIMAEGYNTAADANYDTRFPDVSFSNIDTSGAAIKFTVTSDYSSDIYVTTYARPFNGGGS